MFGRCESIRCRLSRPQLSRLATLEDRLMARVIGQDDAVTAVSRAMTRARCGLKDPRRPIADMLFCGPTGVGKTELARSLAQEYFGSEKAMVRASQAVVVTNDTLHY